mmetsp:Transcript_12416/g.23025  ORF Transcript_12416/g.23025 Transcript_12416/m.23025 type:complete len:296 (+) Transcript_12416:198-1085(+)
MSSGCGVSTRKRPLHSSRRATAADVADLDGRIVLSEDDYVLRLSRLIRRDFFPDAPGLPQVKPGAEQAKTCAGKQVTEDLLSVDNFHRFYTSAKSASFGQLQEKAIALSREKVDWATVPRDKPIASLLLGDRRTSKSEQVRAAQDRVKHKSVIHSNTRISIAQELAWSSAQSVGACTETSSMAGQALDEDGKPLYNGYSLVPEQQPRSAYESEFAAELDSAASPSLPERDLHAEQVCFRMPKRSRREEVAFQLGRQNPVTSGDRGTPPGSRLKHRKGMLSKAGSALAASLLGPTA